MPKQAFLLHFKCFHQREKYIHNICKKSYKPTFLLSCCQFLFSGFLHLQNLVSNSFFMLSFYYNPISNSDSHTEIDRGAALWYAFFDFFSKLYIILVIQVCPYQNFIQKLLLSSSGSSLGIVW